MNAVAILIQAGIMISKPENWTQGALARRASGIALANPAAASARQWCAIGAVYAAAGINPARPDQASNEKQKACYGAMMALNSAAHRIHRKTAERVNDDGAHGDALELMRAAIRHERAAPPSLQN